MAKNQRQRRPLQDDTRNEKQTVRERAQVSKRQRDRIEENRDRREQRRERQRLRRQTVDSVRSPKEDVRTDRFDSRLVPIEETFLGRPVGSPTELPVLIGELWVFTTPASITATASSDVTIVFDTSKFTTERNGYPSIYNPSTGIWRIPSGLSGIWSIHAQAVWSSGSDSSDSLKIQLNGATDIATNTIISDTSEHYQTISVIYQLQEADEFEIIAHDGGGADGSILSQNGIDTYAFVQFLGK